MTIQAVYQDGVFHPLGPVELPEGARVQVITVDENATQAIENGHSAKATMPLVGEELAALLERIDSLPLEGELDPDLSTTYREVLYPKHGDMP